uniref:Uncharacterized protein n=1 Tax=Trichogramma kaykai TaxID=54128 RepID=A0ABD2XG02_9HYME
MNFFKTRLKLVKLKSLRKKFNLGREDERGTFLRKLEPIIDDWVARLPDLRDIFSKEEIENLLSTSGNHSNASAGTEFILFVIRTGYKDDPEVDYDGEPFLLHCTTPLLRPEYPSHGYDIVDFHWMLFRIYDRFDVNYTDESGYTHFHIAVKYRCCHMVMKFLEFGHDPNLRVQNTGDTPLHLALSKNDIEMAELLLRNGADPNLSNNVGLTPLHVICMKSDYNNDLAETFFNVNKEVNWVVKVNASMGSGKFFTTRGQHAIRSWC